MSLPLILNLILWPRLGSDRLWDITPRFKVEVGVGRVSRSAARVSGRRFRSGRAVSGLSAGLRLAAVRGRAGAAVLAGRQRAVLAAGLAALQRGDGARLDRDAGRRADLGGAARGGDRRGAADPGVGQPAGGHARLHRHHRRGHAVAGAGAGGAVRAVRVADPGRLRLVLVDAGGGADRRLRAFRPPRSGGHVARRAVDGAQGRVRLPPARLVHPFRGHVRADRELPGVLRAGGGNRAVRIAGLVVPVRPGDVLQPDRRGAVAAGRAGSVARRGRGADARVSGRHALAGAGAAERRRVGRPSSTRSWRSTGSGPRRPAGSTRRPGSRTRRPRCTASARS